LALFLWRALMPSHFGKAQTGGNDAPAAVGRSRQHIRLCGSACEQFVLLGPVHRQIEFGSASSNPPQLPNGS